MTNVVWKDSIELMRQHGNAGRSNLFLHVPYLRKTYNKFISFILEHVSNATFPHPSPSDQGAYLSFIRILIGQIVHPG